MTTQTAVFSGLPTGLTLTAKLFTLAAPDTVAFTADSVTERTNAKGEYVASFGEVAEISGDHTLILFVGSTPVGIGKRTFAGTDAEVATVTPEVAALDTATLAAIASQASVDAVAVQLVDILSLVESVALTGAATYVAASSSTLTTGTLSSGTFADTFTADGVSHVHADSGGAIEVIYDYEMGAAEVAVEILFRGRVTGSNDTILVQAYDWIGTDWETIWSQSGTNGSVATDRAEPLLAKHTGTGADDGKVRIRFYAASGLTSATLYVDQLLIAKTVTEVDLTAGALADIVTQFGTGSTLTSLATAANLTALKTVADKIATVIYGTVTGAGTATEVFVSAGYTVTITVDSSGNRSAVVVT